MKKTNSEFISETLEIYAIFNILFDAFPPNVGCE